MVTDILDTAIEAGQPIDVRAAMQSFTAWVRGRFEYVDLGGGDWRIRYFNQAGVELFTNEKKEASSDRIPV